MNIKIEKRVPFGFMGQWGKVYKHTVFDNSQSAITYQRSSYYDIGADVQFKYLEDGVDKSVINTQPAPNLVGKGEFRLVKTTDAYFNGSTYECVVEPTDIVFFDNSYWVVEKVDDRSVFTPAKQTFYYISMKKIFEEIITGEN